MVFPVVMHGHESWTIKKADAKELMLSNCDAEDPLFVLRLERLSLLTNKSNCFLF